MKKIMFMVSLAILIMPFLVSANILYCLTEGEQLPPSCNGNECRYTCEATLCQICTTDNGFPGVNPATCFGQTCSVLGDDDGASDVEPPVLTINEPVDGAFYGSRRVFFDIETDALSRIEFRKAGENKWDLLCDNCERYRRHELLNEGSNEIIIRAIKNRNNLMSEDSLAFNVDSRLPDFRNSFPKEGDFANGDFTVEYSEENLNKIEFKYKGLEESDWNVINDPNCPAGERQECTLENVDLSAYENGEMEYQFIIYDSANSDEGPVTKVRVDSTDPVMNVNDFGTSGFNDKKIPFDIEVNEEVDLFYIENDDSKNKHKSLCKKCTEYKKEKTFTDGIWDITIYAEDEAGNFDSFEMFFTVDTKKPKIRKTEPSRGYANGDFWAQYDETKLQSLSLFYGITENYQEVVLDNCSSGKKQECEVNNVDLSAFDGGEVDVYWVITDNFFSVSSRISTFDVDVTKPVFNKLEAVQNGDEIEFNIETSEKVDTMYIDSGDSRERARTLCKNEDVCEKTKRFKEGTHTLTITAVDKAGNTVEEVKGPFVI